MGYTHYWERPKTLPKKNWAKFLNELQMLQANLPNSSITAGSDNEEPTIICGWNDKIQDYDRDSLIIQGDEIAFNGEGDLSHETFNMSRVVGKDEYSQPDKKTGLSFSFCKTARKPYDTFVCLALISFKRWFMNDVRVSSDGDNEDWEGALKLYHELTDAHLPNYNMLMKDDSE